MTIIYFLIEYFSTHETAFIIFCIVIALIFIRLLIKIFANLLRDLDYLESSLKIYIKRFINLIISILEFLVIKVLFFPFYLLSRYIRFKDLSYLMVNNIDKKDIEV